MRQFDGKGIFFTMRALGVIAVTSPDAEAQSIARPRTWTVTPFLATSMGISDDAGAENSAGVGVGVGYDWTSNIGFEGEIAYLFDVAGDTDVVDWSITNVSGNFLYHFDVWHSITPYATFGIGFEHSSIDPDPDPLALFPPSSTEVSFNLGGGVKYPLTENLIIRGDLRRFQSNDLAPDFWRLYGGLTFTLGR